VNRVKAPVLSSPSGEAIAACRVVHSVIASAYGGEEAMEIYKQMNEKPDVILIDYRMPQKDVIEATKGILEVNPEARILFVSADESVEEEALATGACSFKLKTFKIKIDELIEDRENTARQKPRDFTRLTQTFLQAKSFTKKYAFL